MTDYLTVTDVLFLHDDQLERYGGAKGVRDMGALESALFRPQTGYYEDVLAEAAAMMESLAMNHPFVDGNKRVAFAATDVFLRINGYRITQDAETIYHQMIEWFEKGIFEFAHIEQWLRKNTRR